MFLAALILGLAGSLHCAGMCSPLVISVTGMNSSAFFNKVVYNLGRIVMYGILGFIVALLGFILPINKFQYTISLVLGASLIFIAIFGRMSFNFPVLTKVTTQINHFVKTSFASIFKKKNRMMYFILGGINGLLPCGLSFIALTFCITADTPWQGFTYMLVFGAGTLPIMLGLVSIVSLVSKTSRINLKHVTTGLMIISGILTIARVFIIHLPHHDTNNIMDIVICR